jgi:diguanylate cyclase (GGDEF)-like protein
LLEEESRTMETHAPAPRVIGRLAGVLLVACGVLSAATLPLPQSPGTDKDMVLLVSLLAVAIGGLAFVAPWERLHPRASLVLLPIAFAIISAGNYLGNAQPYTYSVFFIVAFVWLGLGHPRWTSLPFLLPAAIAYALPFVLRGESTGAAGASVLLVIPVCAFVAETIAWIGARERRSRIRSSSLASVALLLGPHLNVDDLSQTLASEVKTMLRADRGAFFLVRDGKIEHVFSAGFPDEARAALHALTGQPLQDAPGLVDLAAGQPVLTEDTRVHSPLIDDAAGYGVRSYIAVPVLVEDELRGILVSTDHAHARRYRVDDVRSAQALASQASAALRNALLYERTLQAAQCDHLTGLGNRRAFHEQLDTEVERAQRHGRDLSVIVLDVDHLKVVNDARGHIAGDGVLERVADLTREGSRREDGVFRIGGDEFALVLPETTCDQARMMAERIRRAVEASHVGEPTDLTVSIGVSCLPEHGISSDQLFERADTAMYEAKRAGRNAVYEASPPPIEPVNDAQAPVAGALR